MTGRWIMAASSRRSNEKRHGRSPINCRRGTFGGRAVRGALARANPPRRRAPNRANKGIECTAGEALKPSAASWNRLGLVPHGDRSTDRSIEDGASGLGGSIGRTDRSVWWS
jgi:hypothetical protein